MLKFIVIELFALMLMGDADKYAKCFAPVLCSTENTNAEPTWMQVFPSLADKIIEQQCTCAKYGPHLVQKDEIEDLKTEIKELKLENRELKDSVENNLKKLDQDEAYITELQRKQAELNDETKQMRRILNRYCPIFYANKCFLPVMDKKVDKKEAQNICVGKGGKLADIVDETHLNITRDILRLYNYYHGWCYLWTGMTYNTTRTKFFFQTEQKQSTGDGIPIIRNPNLTKLQSFSYNM